MLLTIQTSLGTHDACLRDQNIGHSHAQDNEHKSRHCNLSNIVQEIHAFYAMSGYARRYGYEFKTSFVLELGNHTLIKFNTTATDILIHRYGVHSQCRTHKTQSDVQQIPAATQNRP